MSDNYKNIKSVLIDTNLLILYLTGIYNTKLISDSKRLYKYSSEDFFILKKYLHKFKHLIITPHILTETSNLLFTSNAKKHAFLLEAIKKTLEGFEERDVKKNFILKSNFFEKFGVTDCALIYIAQQKNTIVLTDDSNLWGVLRKMQLPYENFFNIKGQHDFKTH